MLTSMHSCVVSSPLLFPVSSINQPQGCVKYSRLNIVWMKPVPYNIRKGELQISTPRKPPRFKCDAAYNATLAAASAFQTEDCWDAIFCRPNTVGGMQPLYNIRKGSRLKHAAALNATCAAACATQTVTRNPRTITVTRDKVRNPRLADNGPGLPPRDNDGNGGNGGGGGGKFFGGLLLLGFLGVLDILKEIEAELQSKVKDRKFHQA